MLQTRAGHCPSCKQETPPGAELCPSCGQRLPWDKTAPRATPPSTPAAATRPEPAQEGKPARTFLRLFVLFLIACITTMAAVTYRAKFAKTDAPELEAHHAILVQDAEALRDEVATNKANPDAPELAYIIGMAMPNGRDILEITVRNEWKAHDYPTRLNYAAKFVERWKAIHAPHRANITLLDEAGDEIGGRTWTGTVWVKEKHEDAPAAKPTAAPQSASTPVAPGTASNSAADADAAANSVGNSLDNTASNTVSNSASTPASGAPTESIAPPANAPVASNTPATTGATPAPRDANDMPDVEKQ